MRLAEVARIGSPNDDALRPVLRALKQDDIAYIKDSYKKSYRDAERHIPQHLYWPNADAEISNYLRDASIRVACDPEDDNYIWGWCAFDPHSQVLHYAFTRTSARGNGVARLLTAGLAKPLVVSHWTEVAEKIHKKHPGSLLYEPSRRKR